jgi:cytoskeletal protein CcmA (bactofilin family)
MWKYSSKEKKPVENFKPDTTYIGKLILIKGELSGGGSVRVAGKLEGPAELLEGSLTVETEGCILGNVKALAVVVRGRVDGNVFGARSVDLKGSAVVVGNIQTSQIKIEDGASLKGSVQARNYAPALQLKKAG